MVSGSPAPKGYRAPKGYPGPKGYPAPKGYPVGTKNNKEGYSRRRVSLNTHTLKMPVKKLSSLHQKSFQKKE